MEVERLYLDRKSYAAAAPKIGKHTDVQSAPKKATHRVTLVPISGGDDTSSRRSCRGFVNVKGPSRTT